MDLHYFTKIVRSKGWTVREACEYWGIGYNTYNKRCNNAKMHKQLESMCKGLEGKL